VGYVTVNSAVPSHTYTWKKQSGGVQRFAEITLQIRPLPRGSGVVLRFDADETLPEELRRGPLEGILDVLSDATEPGLSLPTDHPLTVTDVEVTVRMPVWHPIDTTADVVRATAASCAREALRRAGGLRSTSDGA
jgi:elongation factor G